MRRGKNNKAGIVNIPPEAESKIKWKAKVFYEINSVHEAYFYSFIHFAIDNERQDERTTQQEL